MMQITGVVLAGGQSRRMGSNKALLELGGKKVIEGILDQMAAVTDQVLVAANDVEVFSYLGRQVVPDRFPGKGPLAGVHAALTAAHTRWCIVSACDMPFVTAGVFRTLAQAVLETETAETGEVQFQAILPFVGGRVQPLLAAYHISSLPLLEKALQSGNLRMTDWLDHLRVKRISEEYVTEHAGTDAGQALFNMNHPGDYRQAKEWLTRNK